MIDEDGHPVRIAEPLWDRPTHEALRRVIRQRGQAHPSGDRVSNHKYLLTGIALCGQCHTQLSTHPTPEHRGGRRYQCKARWKGIPHASACKPSPSFTVKGLDARVENWFLAEYGKGMIMETFYDAGDGTRERIAEVEAARRRLRDDREAGLYDTSDDAEWFRSRYSEMGRELAMLRRLPVRSPGMVTRPTGETIEDKWRKASDDLAKKEILLDFGVRVTLWPASASRRWYAGIFHGPHPERAI